MSALWQQRFLCRNGCDAVMHEKYALVYDSGIGQRLGVVTST